ncbi:hypothetical protein [uncultured Winogradskyella sp.]|uniref:hypothetical protein n=1 Tax=uncultured Winogradskyella sp. TaxID=395353 RepID=UPI00262C3861|nr:hypothetical protein [uncultured Winogradskyella sp.]
MIKTTRIQKHLLIVSVPLLIIIAMVIVSSSSIFTVAPNKLALAITFDLLITGPFIYFLLIRKTTIPKTTIVPFIILGLVVGSFIIPSENQLYLNLFKIWLLPLIEISVLTYITYNVIKAFRLYKVNKTQSSSDFFSILKVTCYDILPKAAVVPFVTEIAVFYYGFMSWKKRQLNTNEFSYHKESGTIGLLIGIMLLIVVETIAIHFLLAKWNSVIAWIITGLSIYTAIQIIGFSKSILKRPIIIEGDLLYLRFGIMNESIIDTKQIESIVLSTSDIELNNETRKLSFLGNLDSHNIVIKLKEEQTLLGLYGFKKTYKTIAFHVDQKHEFIKTINTLIQKKD